MQNQNDLEALFVCCLGHQSHQRLAKGARDGSARRRPAIVEHCWKFQLVLSRNVLTLFARGAGAVSVSPTRPADHIRDAQLQLAHGIQVCQASICYTG